jgi:hypothetical protein
MNRALSIPAQIERLLNNPPGRVKLENFYRVYMGRKQGQQIWIVDGARAVDLLYPFFLYGGNDQRYRFNPDGEVWLDNRMGLSELGYTILHELKERKLMRQRGMTYDRAHDLSIAAEEPRRLKDEKAAATREAEVLHLWENCWRPSALALGSTKLHQIYRRLHCRKAGLNVWEVDGTEVRRMLDGDFAFAGHGLNNKFVPQDEIWLDMNVSIEEAWYSLVGELANHQAMVDGNSEGAADEMGLVARATELRKQKVLAAKHEAWLDTVRYGCREHRRKLS